MCGRTRLARAPEAIQAATQAKRWARREEYRPSSNLCPGRQSPVLHRGECGELELTTMHFGLVPSFTPEGAKPDFFRMMNARSETVATQPAFRRLLPRRRCCVLVDGFYEWQGGRVKQPFYVTRRGGPGADGTADAGSGGADERECGGTERAEPPLLWMAGLWDRWACADGAELLSYAILTADASPEIAWLHDRMPVILSAEGARAWLDVDGTEPASALQHCRPACGLQWHKVHPRIGAVKYEGADAHLPWRPCQITAFFRPGAAGAEATAGAGAASAAGAGAGSGARVKRESGGEHEQAAGSADAPAQQAARPGPAAVDAPGASAGSTPAAAAREGDEARGSPERRASGASAPADKRRKVCAEARDAGGRSSPSTSRRPSAQSPPSARAKPPGGGSPASARTPAAAKPQRSITQFFSSPGGS